MIQKKVRRNKVKIGILTYNVKHRKTYDVLCLLRVKGYQDVNVYGELGTHLANVKAAVGTVNAMVIFEQAKAYMSSDPSINKT